MGFIDILKAFDSVPRKQIWQSLRKRGIKTKLRNNINEVIRNYVRKVREQFDKFEEKLRSFQSFFVHNDHT